MVSAKCLAFINYIYNYADDRHFDVNQITKCAFLFAHCFSRFVAEPNNVLNDYRPLVEACRLRHEDQFEHREAATLIFSALADLVQYNRLYVEAQAASRLTPPAVREMRTRASQADLPPVIEPMLHHVMDVNAPRPLLVAPASPPMSIHQLAAPAQVFPEMPPLAPRVDEIEEDDVIEQRELADPIATVYRPLEQVYSQHDIAAKIIALVNVNLNYLKACQLDLEPGLNLYTAEQLCAQVPLNDLLKMLDVVRGKLVFHRDAQHKKTISAGCFVPFNMAYAGQYEHDGASDVSVYQEQVKTEFQRNPRPITSIKDTLRMSINFRRVTSPTGQHSIIAHVVPVCDAETQWPGTAADAIISARVFADLRKWLCAGRAFIDMRIPIPHATLSPAAFASYQSNWPNARTYSHPTTRKLRGKVVRFHLTLIRKNRSPKYNSECLQRFFAGTHGAWFLGWHAENLSVPVEEYSHNLLDIDTTLAELRQLVEADDDDVVAQPSRLVQSESDVVQGFEDDSHLGAVGGAPPAVIKPPAQFIDSDDIVMSSPKKKVSVPAPIPAVRRLYNISTSSAPADMSVDVDVGVTDEEVTDEDLMNATQPLNQAEEEKLLDSESDADDVLNLPKFFKNKSSSQ